MAAPENQTGTFELQPLPRLARIEVVPSALASNANTDSAHDMTVTMALNRILAVEVCGAVQQDDKTVYEVLIFLHSARSRIPVAAAAGLPVSAISKGEGKPADIRVARSFTQFRELRDAVYYAAQSGHGDGSLERSCPFCASAVDAVLLDQSQPHRYHPWINRTSAVCSLLETFLNEMVQRVLDGLPSSAARGRRGFPRCLVHATAQNLLFTFLQLDAVSSPHAA